MPDYDTIAPAVDLGFALPTGPISGVPPTLSETDAEKFLSEFIRQKALVNVDILAEKLTKRAVDDAASVKTLVDALDANYKLSGLAAKNLAKEVVGGLVSITINMPSKDSSPLVIESASMSSDKETVEEATLALPEKKYAVPEEVEPFADDPDDE